MNARAIEQSFYEFLKTLTLTPTTRIGIGFSGGSDSCALLHLCHHFLPPQSFDVVYFAHGDNPLVDDDTAAIDFCKARCQELELELQVVELHLEKTKSGWEGSGHTARKNYALSHYDVYFLGHHLDDKCENFFIQFFRGAGSAKVLKSEEVMKRPLLEISKTDIKDYLIHKNIAWLEDKTNDNTDITRNFWRKNVLPSIEAHYPDYRSRVNTALRVEESHMALLKDLALCDGLQTLVEHHRVTLPLSLEPRRIQNVLYFYCKAIGVNTQQPVLEDFVKQISRPQKEIEKDLFSQSCCITKNAKEGKLTLSFYPKTTTEPKPPSRKI